MSDRDIRHAPEAAPPFHCAPRPRRPPGSARALTITIFWLGLIMAIAPWCSQTPGGAVSDAAGALTALGRITGLAAGYVVLVQVMLMARLPGPERWLGARELLQRHRELGVFVAVAVGAHAGCIVLGYALFEQVSPPHEIVRLLTVDKYHGMAAAFLATAVLVAVAVLAVPTLRRRLPYEVWHAIHATAYVVLVLSMRHQFSTGQELSRPGLWQDYWLALWWMTAISVVWGRLIAPLRLNRKHRFRVDTVAAEGQDVFSIYVTGRRLAELDVRAGQFFRWRFLDRHTWWQAHPFSMSAAPNGRWLRLTVKVVGDHTATLRTIRPGTPVFLEGPSGDFTADRRRRGRALLIAGGSGIGPVRALLEELPMRSVVLYRARTVDELVFRAELESLARIRDAQLWYILGNRDESGPKRILTAAGLTDLVPDLRRRDVYLCGSQGLVDAAVLALRSAGLPAAQIHLDPFEF